MENKYQTAIKWLYSHINFEALANPTKLKYKFDLDRLRPWFDQSTFKPLIIHVAGTKGKGSVCMMIEKIIRENGLTTGLYTSPHLYQINERVRIQGQPIDDDEFVKMLELIFDMKEKLELSFFEIMTIAALKYFNYKNVDWVILETGLGGRLDSTNIVTPFLSVLTRIDFDHTQFLGNTLDKISTEKAGIIKSNIPSVALFQKPEVNSVFKTTASLKNSALHWSESKSQFEENFALVSTTINLINKLQNTKLMINENIKNLTMPGRYEKFIYKQKIVILDVAHNPVSFQFLADKLKTDKINNPILVFASAKDKDVEGSSEILKLIAKEILIPAIDYPRMAAPTDLAKHFLHATIFESFNAAIEKAIDSPTKVIVITGSFHLIEKAGNYFSRNASY